MTTKFIPNSNRNIKGPAYKPYVPQYKLRGLEPQDFVGTKGEKFLTPHKPIVVKGTPDMSLCKPTFRGMPSAQNVPFAEAVSTQQAFDIPNIGNNNENVWSGIDQFVIDDMGLDQNHQMIDNNNFVDIDAGTSKVVSDAIPTDVISNQIEMNDDEYLLAIEDNIIATGSRETIEEQVRQLVFGEHELCDGKQIPANDIMVLKRLKIKVGVFLE